MARRTFITLIWIIGLALSASLTLAQELTPTPADAQTAEQGELVSIVVGGDLLDRAGLAFDNGEYEKAVQDYSLFLLLNPTFSQAYYFRGMAYSRLNDFDHALADMNQALAYPQASDEFTGMIYNDRALIYALQDDVEAALDDLDASIAAAPDLPDAYARRAQLYLFQEQYEEALADYDKVIELAPDYSPAYAGRAAANLSLGNAEEALADYDHLIELEPENAGAYANRAILNAGLSKYEAALTDMNAAIRLTPDDASLYLQRAAIHNALEMQVDAAADYLEWIRRQETRSVDGDRLQPGESQVLPMENGLSYQLPFEASTEQTITLSARARENSTTDPLIVLLDSEGEPVAGNDDSGDSLDSAINGYVIPADGIYTLVVSHAGGNPDGPVRVLLELG